MPNNQPQFSPGAVELGVAVAGVAANAACWELQNLNAFKIGLVSFEIILATAVATTVGLVRPTVEGTSSGDSLGESVGMLNVNTSGDLSKIVTGFSAEPTYAGTPLYIKRGLLTNVVGERLLWTWPEDNPLVIGPAASIALRNLGAGVMAVALVNARWLGRLPV